jgi:hypothetical protein
MSFEYLKHFFGEAHYLVIEVGVLVLGVLTIVRLVRRDINDLRKPPNRPGNDKEE